jgi:hypothetical protein
MTIDTFVRGGLLLIQAEKLLKMYYLTSGKTCEKGKTC